MAVTNWHRKEGNKSRHKDFKNTQKIYINVNETLEKGGKAFQEIEKEIYKQALKQLGGSTILVSKFFGVTIRTVYNKRKKYDLYDEGTRPEPEILNDIKLE